MTRPRPHVLPPLALLLPAGILALLLGVAGGLVRVGASLAVDVPAPAVAWHGPLILFGFLGVLVATERAVALRTRWSYAAPACGILGTAMLVAGLAPAAVAGAWCAAGALSGGVVLAIERRHPSLANRCMLASCVAWVVGVALWGVGMPLEVLVPWWGAFLVLMIVGERVQFGKLEWLRRTPRVLGILAVLLLVGALLALVDPVLGMRVSGSSMLLLAVWLLVVDVSRRIVRPGLLWFVSVGLAAGYAWLGVAGACWLLLAPVLPGPAHDAALHALFQGFVMGMVFAHAPMIFPAVTGLRMPYHRGFHVHLALLHAGLAVRVGADLLHAPQLARIGSITTAFALALFVLVQAAAALQGRRQRHEQRLPRAARAGA